MKLSNMQLIREGNERVLAARLADAKFFFDEDRKTSLADRVANSSRSHSTRNSAVCIRKPSALVAMAAHVAGQLGDDRVIQDCRRAAELSKG